MRASSYDHSLVIRDESGHTEFFFIRISELGEPGSSQQSNYKRIGTHCYSVTSQTGGKVCREFGHTFTPPGHTPVCMQLLSFANVLDPSHGAEPRPLAAIHCSHLQELTPDLPSHRCLQPWRGRKQLHELRAGSSPSSPQSCHAPALSSHRCGSPAQAATRDQGCFFRPLRILAIFSVLDAHSPRVQFSSV